MNIKKIVTVYTDGACKGNPGRGGWGVVLNYNNIVKELYGGENNTTNNHMELMATIKALNVLKYPCKVKLYTDSKYVQQGVCKWLDNWISSGWKTSNNKDVKNKDLWVMLEKLRYQHNVEWIWVKGHNGNRLNERADLLANKGALSD